MEMACLAILTAPRKDGEPLDAFVQRVLHKERQQDQEAAAARDLGTRIHAAIEQALNGEQYDTGLREYVELSFQEILRTGGALMQTEKIVVGDRYAGKLDALTQHDGLITIWDIKSCRNLPKYGSYIEAKLQLASYAQALGNTGDARIQTANLYVSTSEPGQIKVDTHQDWQETYERGFRPLVDYFYWANDL